jgi:Flp pilus assembly pilin Flp
MTRFWTQLLTGDLGQDLIEYTLMLAFVALASAALFASAGGTINTIWSNADTQLSTAAGS